MEPSTVTDAAAVTGKLERACELREPKSKVKPRVAVPSCLETEETRFKRRRLVPVTPTTDFNATELSAVQSVDWTGDPPSRVRDEPHAALTDRPRTVTDTEEVEGILLKTTELTVGLSKDTASVAVDAIPWAEIVTNGVAPTPKETLRRTALSDTQAEAKGVVWLQRHLSVRVA